MQNPVQTESVHNKSKQNWKVVKNIKKNFPSPFKLNMLKTN